MIKQLELFPETKPAEKVVEKKPVQKQNPLDKLPAAFVENYNKYDAEDGQNVVVGPNGQIMMESELKKDFEKEVVNKTKELSEDKIVTKQRPIYPKRATPEQVGKLAERLERNAQMSGGKGPFTGSNNSWDAIIDVSKNDPAEMKEIKKTLFKEYNRSGTKYLSDKELKIIKKGKYTEYPKVNIAPPIVPAAPVEIKQPEIPIEEQIRRYSDAKLKAQQDQWDYEHGKFGLSNLMRPK